jgi:methylglutaconyl-CoA hydratase
MTATTRSPLAVERHGAVLWLTLDRAEVRNALNPQLLDALTDAIRQAPADPEIRAIVLTGAGDRAFCAGGDLSRGAATFAPDPTRAASPYAELLAAARACPLPLVARVNGHALAGGLGLVGMCDLAVAADTAKLGLPEVKIGMFPMMASALLRRVMGPRALAELALTGEPITAAEAQAVGLVNYVVGAEELDAKVQWLLDRLTDKSPTAQRRGKLALEAIGAMTLAESLAFMDGQLGTLANTEDSAEGRRAFNEKRPPVWTGR